MNYKLSVIVPALNEEGNIVWAVQNIIESFQRVGCSAEIIVVNDCSKDNTESILRGISLSGLKVIHHVSNRGKAAAVRTGLENAVGEFIFIQNGNLNIEADNYFKLLAAIKDSGADIVLGTRSSKIHQGAPVLQTQDYFSTLMLNILFGVKLHDWSSHFQFIRRESFLNLAQQLKGKDIAFEILTKGLRNKMRVIEVPIFHD